MLHYMTHHSFYSTTELCYFYTYSFIRPQSHARNPAYCFCKFRLQAFRPVKDCLHLLTENLPRQ